MKNLLKVITPIALLFSVACSNGTSENAASTASTSTETPVVGQSGVQDETSDPNVVQIAVGSYCCKNSRISRCIE